MRKTVSASMGLCALIFALVLLNCTKTGDKDKTVSTQPSTRPVAVNTTTTKPTTVAICPEQGADRCKLWQTCRSESSSIKQGLEYGHDCFQLGFIYEIGQEIKRDVNKAMSYYKLGCRHGYGRACLHVGLFFDQRYVKSKDAKSKAFAYFRRACRLEIAAGCTHTAFYFDLGVGVKARSDQKALHAFEKACKLGDNNACSQAGMFYAGIRQGAKQDVMTAVDYFSKACIENDGQGCKYLGQLYRDGLGVKQDAKEAYNYFAKSCRVGHAHGCYEQAMLYLKADKKLQKKEWEETRALLEKACKSHASAACNQLGILLQSGKGISKDEKQAFQLFERACKDNYRDGCLQLAISHKKGIGTKRDPEKYALYMQKVCQLRGLDSCYQLAQDYIEGKDHTPKDQAKARNLLQTSCALGHSASCELLKKMK